MAIKQSGDIGRRCGGKSREERNGEGRLRCSHIDMLEYVVKSVNKSNKSHQHKDGCNNAVYEPHGADVEVRAHFVDEKSNHQPPSDGSGCNAYIPKYIMWESVRGIHEVEPGEKANDEEENQWI